MKTFFCEEGYETYIALTAKACKAAGTEVWVYCLMPNHGHLVRVPKDEDGLRATLGEAHRPYTRSIPFREKGRGPLWQERFIAAFYHTNVTRRLPENRRAASLMDW